jgi:hypothetical protein
MRSRRKGDPIRASATGQKNVRQKNDNSYFSVSHFSVRSVWSGRNDDHSRRLVINLPIRFWERAIPKADRSPDTLIVSLNSNHVIPELTPPAESGTPLGYLKGMTT